MQSFHLTNATNEELSESIYLEYFPNRERAGDSLRDLIPKSANHHDLRFPLLIHGVVELVEHVVDSVSLVILYIQRKKKHKALSYRLITQIY